jgi:serine/threonine protein kinase
MSSESHRLASHMEFNFEERQGEGLRSRLPPDASADLIDLLHRMLSYEPHARISAGEALRHPFFQEVVENELEMEKSAL